MKILGSTIECYRGETFTIQREFRTKDGIPYVVDLSMQNPYVRFTVKSNTHDIDGEYKKNYWLDVSNMRKGIIGEVYPFPNNTIPDNASSIDTSKMYYIVDDEMNREYYIFDDTWKKYSFVIKKSFLNTDTRKWIGQIYEYEIALCSGTLTSDWLKRVFRSLYSDLEFPDTNDELAFIISKKRPDLVENVSLNRPLVTYTNNIILQKPSKLIVKEN